MISGHGTVETAVEAIRIGADFLEKPLSTAKLLITVERALRDSCLTNREPDTENPAVAGHELRGS